MVGVSGLPQEPITINCNIDTSVRYSEGVRFGGDTFRAFPELVWLDRFRGKAWLHERGKLVRLNCKKFCFGDPFA